MKVYLILLMPLIVACGSSKKVAQKENAPDWVTKRPTDAAFYYGIGSATKQGDDYLYQKKAKEVALSDLISEISTEVSTYSVLSQIENNDQFTQDFTQSIRLRSSKSLTGYEIVNTFDDGRRYWILYRLNKTVYRQKVSADRQKAIDLALQKLAQADSFKKENNLRSAIIWHIKALEAIKNYLDDPLETNWKGSDIHLGNHLYLELVKTISGIKISGPEKIECVRSLPLTINYIISDQEAEPLDNIPLYITYSGLSLGKRDYTSNFRGNVQYELKAVKSEKKLEKVSAVVNLDKLAEEATRDNMVRRIVTQKPALSVTTILEIRKPVLKLAGLNQAEEAEIRDYILKSSIGELFEIRNSSTYDYLLEVTEMRREQSKNRDINVFQINGVIALKTMEETPLLTVEIKGERGLHYDENKALNKATENWEKEFQRKLIPKLRQLLSGL